MTGPSRTIVLIAVAVISLVVAAIVTVLAFAPSASHFAPGSPEDVFQSYLAAYQRRDFETAYGYFSARAQHQLSLDAYVRYARTSYGDAPESHSRIAVERVEEDDRGVTLYLTIENSNDSGLDVGRYSYDVTIPLVKEASVWKIDQLLLGTSPAPVAPITQ